MPSKLDSSAPYISGVSVWDKDLVDWGEHLDPLDRQSRNSGRLLWNGNTDGLPEAGLWVSTQGSWRLELPRDEFCHFVSGSATYTSDEGEVIEVSPGTVVHFCEDWAGTVVVHQTIRCVYMLA